MRANRPAGTIRSGSPSPHGEVRAPFPDPVNRWPMIGAPTRAALGLDKPPQQSALTSPSRLGIVAVWSP